ncbi:MAG: PqqD family protein [Thermodesulfobacteriota bacterium]
MDGYGKYTRRGFINLSVLSSLFYAYLPGLGGLDRFTKEVKSPLKRFLLQGSHPIMEPVIQKRWVDGSLIITVEGREAPLFILNETSGFILDQCDGNHTPSDIVKRLRMEFDVDEKRAREDIFDTLEGFYSSGIIKV